MGGKPSGRLAATILFLLAVLVFVAAVWVVAFRAALDQASDRAGVDISLAADRLTSKLQGYRELAVFLSDHPDLTALVLDSQGSLMAATELLQSMTDKTGSHSLHLIDGSGNLLATSGAAGVAGWKPAVDRAMTGALGSARYVNADGRRFITYGAPIFRPNGPAAGAILVTVDVAAIEWNWPSDPSPVFFTGVDGRVFVTNRTDLVSLTLPGHAADNGSFPIRSRRSFGGHEIWQLSNGPYLPDWAIHLTEEVPVIDMRAGILLDLRPSFRIASLQAAVAAALCLAFGAMLFLATERRRVLTLQLQREAHLNLELETRVKARTSELSEANVSLRHEIRERQEAETALRRAQADLVQAGKLSALGQMSAGLSHELNQPLMAIRSFAENAETYLAQGKADTAASNLGRISDLARRMARIIKNLRAFAKQESEDLTDVDLVAVIRASLELLETRLETAGIAVEWHEPPSQVMVRGGEVRLQQVVTNLLSNAMDATVGQADRRIRVDLAENPGGATVLQVRDNGPGIDNPGKIFDPFYSTKEVGQSEGMGLGLSISYGLVQSFGGSISGANQPEGGAVFTVELAPASMEIAA